MLTLWFFRNREAIAESAAEQSNLPPEVVALAMRWMGFGCLLVDSLIAFALFTILT